MIVTKKRPAPIKTPVQVTREKYELWYSKPVCLGTVDLKQNQWVTADSKKFVSSRDALDYLALIHELNFTVDNAPEEIRDMAAAKVYQTRAHKSYKGRGVRSFKKKVEGSGFQMPKDMTLDDLKGLVEMADRLRGLIEPVSKLSVVKEKKKNDSMDKVQEATRSSKNATNGK